MVHVDAIRHFRLIADVFIELTIALALVRRSEICPECLKSIEAVRALSYHLSTLIASSYQGSSCRWVVQSWSIILPFDRAFWARCLFVS